MPHKSSADLNLVGLVGRCVTLSTQSDELTYDEPPIVLGTGALGPVGFSYFMLFLCTYRR